MDTEELVETLKTAGLSPYQADAYVALLNIGAASATEIAEAGEVPQPRIYDVLDALESAGYVETYETGSLHARAHSPAEVLDDLRDRAERFEEAAEEVENRWEQPKLESNRTSIVKKFQTVRQRAKTFIETAEYQIQLSVTPADFERLRPQLVDAYDRGVSIRLSIHTNPEREEIPTERFEGACLEARHRRLPAPFVALVDRKKTCFAHHPDSYDQYGVLVDDRTHTYVFHWYFLTCLWEHWETVYSAYDDSFPVKYVDIRQCVRDLKPLVEAGSLPKVEIDGFDVDSGEPVSESGVVTAALMAGGTTDSDHVNRLSGQVTLVIDVGTEEQLTVGGWGAMLEDVEATRINVVDIDGAETIQDAQLSSRL